VRDRSDAGRTLLPAGRRWRVGGTTLSPRSGRRPGAQGTREAILAAARRSFGELGFNRATIRKIAADAGVDPALVLHYFGNKADLFAAAVDLPVPPSGPLAVLASADPARLGEAILRTVLTIWEVPERLAAWLGLIRSAASDERAARMLREFLTSTILGPVADALDVADADRRVALVASQVVGLGIARYVVALEPLATASSDELLTTIGPVLQHYLTGDLRPAGADAPEPSTGRPDRVERRGSRQAEPKEPGG
jgi:AcrR family transcriptional regulator